MFLLSKLGELNAQPNRFRIVDSTGPQSRGMSLSEDSTPGGQGSELRFWSSILSTHRVLPVPCGRGSGEPTGSSGGPKEPSEIEITEACGPRILSCSSSISRIRVFTFNAASTSLG